jgi:hypothetical protein
MEAVDAAVPLLGIPLQGDQPHNLQRLVELGVAAMVQLTDITTDDSALKIALERLLSKHGQYQHRAQRVASMLVDYQQFTGANMGGFYMHWALRHGKMITSKADEYIRLQSKDDRYLLCTFVLILAVGVSFLAT